jgi:hypothetical protein
MFLRVFSPKSSCIVANPAIQSNGTSKRFSIKTFKFIPRWIFAGVLGCLFVFVFSGCETDTITPRPTSMRPQPLPQYASHPEKVFVTVLLEGTTNNAGFWSISTPAFAQSFREALAQSLAASKLFTVGETARSSEFELEVTILKGAAAAGTVVRGGVGPEVSAVMITEWRFLKTNDKSVVWETYITSDTADKSFVSTWRNATEQSAADNIRKGLEWLASKTH